ncbi:MAG: Plug domain-containing protein [Thiohalomonadales bacterium]
MSKISLTREEIINAPGTEGDPLKVITSLPGVVATFESSADVYMRGSDARENYVWINRAPVGYLYHMGGFHSTINPSLIDDLNIFLAGFPETNTLHVESDMQLQQHSTYGLIVTNGITTVMGEAITATNFNQFQRDLKASSKLKQYRKSLQSALHAITDVIGLA